MITTLSLSVFYQSLVDNGNRFVWDWLLKQRSFSIFSSYRSPAITI
jgi:hypothetical protein